MSNKKPLIALLAMLLALISLSSVSAELVAVSQFGYHPDSHKQIVSYTSSNAGSVTIFTSAGVAVMTTPLGKPVDYSNNQVACQGNNPCLVADISALRTPGTYYAVSSFGGRSPNFVVSNTVYQQNNPVFLEFFNAQLQQKSAYHADKHAGYTPQFNAWADGSPIMEADQAAITLIRMGSAYRENPQFFSTDSYTIYAAGKPDMQEYMRTYVEFLKGLQGVRVQEKTDGSGFRLDRGIKIENAFVPGPTSRTSLDVYIPGSPPTKLQTVPVVSLCGHLSGSAYTTCVNNAANYYKCQVDEPCLNITYVDRTGAVSYQPGDYAVSTGWSYEFGCYIDILLDEPQYNNRYNPCLIFKPETSKTYTVHTLLAYLEALPAISAYSSSEGQQLFNRAVDTHTFVKNNYALSADEHAFMGAAEFLLYDYTGNASYLQAAHNRRGLVSKTFISDRLQGNEYYWEEYVRHKSQITAAGLTYPVGENPEEFFRGKMWGDWKDLGAERSISRTGERVFQFDNNIQFQNSRFMLTEALFSAKTVVLHPNAESFIPVIADAQLAWLTGQNAVQMGTGSNPPIESTSFIFGIGDFPAEQHSRMFVNSGYNTATGGRVIGARGTSYQFFDGTNYIYLDGTASILGFELGSLGNNYRGETYNEPFDLDQTFMNGKTYIPGWINGAFDIREDTDIIFNYRDTTGTYENTETTNEMVATAIELIAYLDAERNNKPRAAVQRFTYTGSPSCTPTTEVCDAVDNDCDGQTDEGSVCTPTCVPSTEVCDGADNDCDNAIDENNVCTPTNTCYNSVRNIPASCTGGSISSDTWNGCRQIICTSGSSSMQILACDKGTKFEMYKQSKVGGAISKICIDSTCIQHEGYMASPAFPICTGGGPTCTPSTEVCDGNDNDCDGQTDENNVCAPTCTPTAEVCDSADNDCDGQVDENNVCGSNTCYNSVKDAPVSCERGSITSDTWNGCRTVQCGSGTNTLKVLACDKGTAFEMYKQSQTGTGAKICLGTTCIDNDGYKRSTNFPICGGSTCTPTTEVCDSKDNDCDGQTDEGNVCAPTCTPSTEVCDGADNDCDSSIDEGGVCGSSATVSVAPWYPKGRDYVFKCAATNSPTKYEWFFGDGNKNLWAGADVYYTYASAGTYTVTCNAVGATTVSGTMQVSVS